MSGKAKSGCAELQRFADTYVDGEFGEREKGEFEAHLNECEACRNKVRVQAAWKCAVRKAAPQEPAPPPLRSRIDQVLSLETTRRGAWQRYRMLIGGVAAAGLVLGFASSRLRFSPVTADVLAKHRRNLPIEVSGGADQVRRWYVDKVDFPVRVPTFGNVAALRGGRLANIREQQAAYLLYDFNGTKVSVFVFNPRDMNLDARRKVQVGQREVFFDDERGYHVAMVRDDGLGYAIASDLGEDQMTQLVSALRP